MIDHTHDPSLQSWVRDANGHPDFPIQNLPVGVFSPLAGAPRGGIAIGDHILDLRALHEAELLDDEAQAALHACIGPTLNGFFAMGTAPRRALRDAVSALLQEGSDERPYLLHRAASCMMYMPARVGDYTDFYAGIHHATNAGRLFRPDAPLMPNYKWAPIAYHGRASTLRLSGEVRRPAGQRKPARETEPTFGPSRNLDYELELGVWIGQGNAPGTSIPIEHAAEHIAGYCLLNDWSARDIQGWEYQPLGPFLGKSFCTTISAWVVTPEALAPFRTAQAPRPDGDPAPLPYLSDADDQAAGALAIELEVLLRTDAMRAQKMGAHRLSIGDATHLYLDPGTDGRASREQRLQPQSGRPVRHRHYFGADCRRVRVAAGDHPGRPVAPHHAIRRGAALFGGRRRGRAAGAGAQAGSGVDRFRRVPRRRRGRLVRMALPGGCVNVFFGLRA